MKNGIKDSFKFDNANSQFGMKIVNTIITREHDEYNNRRVIGLMMIMKLMVMIIPRFFFVQ